MTMTMMMIVICARVKKWIGYYDNHYIPHRIHVWYIYANIWGILMVNVTIYSIHGSYGYSNPQNDPTLWLSGMQQTQTSEPSLNLRGCSSFIMQLSGSVPYPGTPKNPHIIWLVVQ